MKKNTTCIICRSPKQKTLFTKSSSTGEPFTLVKCGNCGLEYLAEVPGQDELSEYYEKQYFTERTDRGYNNYFSTELKSEIERVFKLNLIDLDFFEFEKRVKGIKRTLDTGCAAGYFVSYMKDRGWEASGIDVSRDCVEFAKNSQLDVVCGDYMAIEFPARFHLITLWATIEHLHNPDEVLEKIHGDLEEEGMLYISTCRTGGLNFKNLFGKNWRYYNFPEHIYFFSRKTIKKLLKQKGFRVTQYVTYGSNFGKSGTTLRKVADFIARRCYTGDMMLIAAVKN